MVSPDAQYVVKNGKLFVNSEPVPLRSGIVTAALARAGWRGHEGALPLAVVESMLRLDQRISVIALAREVQPAA